MAAKRTLTCKCGKSWKSQAKIENIQAGKIKCKKCGNTNLSYTDVEATVAKPKEKEKQTCPRCKGDGFWHTSATGVRLKTIAEPLVDESRQCPLCKGAGKV